MVKPLKGSETEKNILKAFVGESQARNRYTFFASKAKDEGFQAIGMIFEETANQEKEHAKRLFKLLEGGDIEVSGSYPAGKIGTTLENLRAAAFGEHDENTNMYPAFAVKALEEGFESIANIFKEIGIAERYHEARYTTLADKMEDGTLFKSDHDVLWRCKNCGHWTIGKEAPEFCPACNHPRGYQVCEGTTAMCDTREGFCEFRKGEF